jgi:hypothetical protein
MNHQSIAAALTLAFLAFNLSVLPVTTAEAGCAWYTGDSCPKDLIESTRPPAGGGNHYVYCCAKPSQVKADCEGKGPNYRYNLDTGSCMKVISKKSGQTEEQSSSEHSSDYGDDDHHHRKKNKRHHDADTQANDKLRQCTKLCEKQCLSMRDVPLDKCVNQCLIGTRC